MTVLCALSFVSLARAAEYPALGPLRTRNQNPVYLQFIGMLPTAATALSRGTWQMDVGASYSSLFEQGVNGATSLNLDMELMRATYLLRYGAGDGFELGVEIPVLHFDGGFLDGFVHGFHNAFGFPTGGREHAANGEYSYRLSNAGGDVFNLHSQAIGFGDITLRIKQQLFDEREDMPAIAWFFDALLPTGDQGDGFGSGSPGYGLGLATQKSKGRFHGYLNVGYYIVPGNDWFPQYMRNAMLAYTITGELSIFDNWSAMVQLDGSTPLLAHTGIDAWDGVPLDLVVGFQGQELGLLAGNDLTWQFAFVEDVTSGGPSVDFTVYATIGVRFGAHQKEKKK